MAEEQTEEKAAPLPQRKEWNVPASVAVCEENLEALLRAVGGRPELEPPIAPAAEVSPPRATDSEAPSGGTLSIAETPPPVISHAATEAGAQGTAERSPAPEGNIAVQSHSSPEAQGGAEGRTAEPSSAAATSVAPGPEALAAVPQGHLVSKLALLASIKQRRAATAHPETPISSSAGQRPASTEVPPAEWVFASAAAPAKDAATVQVERGVQVPQESGASAKEVSHSAEEEPRPEVRPAATATKSTEEHSAPVASTLFVAPDRPRKVAASRTLKSFVTSGPVLGTLAGVIVTIGFTAFLLMGHTAKSTLRAPKQAARESVQNTGTDLPPASLSTGSFSSTPPEASAGADRSRMNDKGASEREPSARPAPAQSVQTAPEQPAQTASAQPPAGANRLVARTFAPPVTRNASPQSSPLLDIPPALSPAMVPSAPLAPGVGALPSSITPPPSQPPAPTAAAPSAPPRQINVAGSVLAIKLITKVTPVYPPLARTAHVEGTVRFRAVIAADGRVKGLVTLSGPPPLIQPAADAVKQWRYQPTLRNGEPVEVVTDIDVAFKL